MTKKPTIAETAINDCIVDWIKWTVILLSKQSMIVFGLILCSEFEIKTKLIVI